MKNNNSSVDKLFSTWTLGLCLAGLMANFLLTQLVIFMGWPLYLDNVGSIIVAALGGVLPGIAVGFLSNVLGSIGTPSSLYYGIITVAIAYIAARYAQRRVFNTFPRCLSLVPIFVLLGGALGSVFTWFLYGASIGGVAEPYARMLVASFGLGDFWAQLLADIGVDIGDKTLTVLLVYGILRAYPQALYDVFPQSYLFDRSQAEAEEQSKELSSQGQRSYLEQRIVRLVATFIAVVSIVIIAICGLYHYQQMKDTYIATTTSVARMAASSVDGDKLQEYLEDGRQSLSFRETEEQLQWIKKNNKNIKYIYVYKPVEKGFVTVFDLDTEEVPGRRNGVFLPAAQEMEEQLEDMLKGKPIPPRYSDGEYGNLLSVCEPVRDHMGKVVAYAAADTDLDSYFLNLLIYLIQIIAVAFGMSILIIVWAIIYAQKQLTQPIKDIIELTRAFERANPQQWLQSEAWQKRQPVKTDDELEELYETVCHSQQSIVSYVEQLLHTKQKLEQSEALAKVNRELERAMTELQEANRVKSEFYSRMSHDMRTPMNGIVGLINLSKDETNVEVLKENLHKIDTASHYLLGLINDTLDMSKIESNRLKLLEEPVVFCLAIKELKAMIMPSIEEKKLHLEIDNVNIPTDAMLYADNMRLKQIYMNLISNAIKFTPEGGTIKIRFENLGVENNITHELVTITDTGVGMSPEFLQHGIFQPFSQERNAVTREYAGTGLGLAIVKNLVQLMGGTIKVDSVLGKGTTFVLEFRFRLATANQLRQHQLEQEGLKSWSADYSVLKDKKVLLCEDHPLNTEIAQRLLAKQGMIVEHAENGKVGVECFANSPLGYYDVVLMDIRMPIMDGLEATRAIRALPRADAKSVMIIAMTANTFVEDVRNTRKAGMNAHLAKPIEPKLLYSTLVVALEKKEKGL